MTLRRVSIPSPNYSSRGGAQVTTIVLHTAEGATTYQSLGSFFANPSSQVSSHTGIDDTPNTVGEYVPRSGKAWTAGNANPWSIQTELCAFAKWDSAEWQRHPNMLANCAAWIAEEAAYFGIPLVNLSASQAQNPAVKGVCQHNDLGSMGGGHWDCGPAFPIDQVLAMAAGGAAPTPEPEPEPEVPDMIAAPCTFTIDNVQQAFYVAGGRLIHCYAPPGKAWVSEPLSDGWDPDSGLAHDVGVGGVDQVWGVLANGKRAQCYWSGSRWVTQPLP
jgi:hypothetical protein